MSADKAAKAEEIKNSEKIFMIEVVIQKVFLDLIEMSDLTFNNMETCLSYKFLDHGPFRICEKDFRFMKESAKCVGCGTIKNGHSTMFPLFPEQIAELEKKGFKLDVEVLKMYKPLPRTVGVTEVDMKQIFKAVMETMLKKYVDTTSKSMKARYRLTDEQGNPGGYVDLFVRLSSMGKVIVTKFQMDTAHECMEFHSNTGTPYTYQKKKNVVDDFVCGPCGQPTRAIPPYERVSKLPAGFPAFKVTAEMKERLQTRRYQELGIEPPPPPPPKKPKGGKGAGAAKGKPSAPSPPPPPPTGEGDPTENEGAEDPAEEEA